MSRYRTRSLTTALVGVAAAAAVAGLTACQPGTVEARTAPSSLPAAATSTVPAPAAGGGTGGSAPATVEAAFAAAPASTAGPTAAAGAPASAGTSDAGSSDARQDRCSVPLPDQVVGAPAVTPGGVEGVWVWHDGTGWHLRVTHPGTNAEVFTGSVRSAQTITAGPYALEKGDSFQLSADHHVLTFSLTNHGRIDGLDLTDQCAIFTQFGFQRAGAELPASAVHLGAHGVAAATDPFVVRRAS